MDKRPLDTPSINKRFSWANPAVRLIGHQSVRLMRTTWRRSVGRLVALNAARLRVKWKNLFAFFYLPADYLT